jgi:glycopeptide antibiotics resistance protein
MLPDSLVFSVALLVVAVTAWLGARRRTPPRRVALQAVLVVYVAWIVSMTLFPVPLDGAGPFERVASDLNRPNALPLHTIAATLQLDSAWQRTRLVLGNVLVFVPFGLLTPALGARLRSWPRALLAGLAFSAAIEVAQLSVSVALGYWYRMPDVDDVLLNVAGVALGYGLFVALSGATSRSR